MATIIDQTEPTLEEGEEFGNLDELTITETPVEEIEEEEEPSQEEETPAPEDNPNIPDKFKGKSVEDIIHSYTELEREYGRRSNEVGELRKITDEILANSLQVNTAGREPESTGIEVDDLLENPNKAIENAVSNSPTLKALEKQLEQARRDELRKGFETKYPNAYDLVVEPGFQEFIQASPVRQAMFKDAHENYNYAVAGELIDMYSQLHKVKVESAEEERKVNRDKSLKDASVEKGTSGQTSKKIFKRADLLKMMRNNPKGYHDEAFQAALRAAYQEGRVR